MSAIRVLPALVVDQIAAGEVIERPASVARELLDNAIDAGATRIVVRIESGGRELIEVSDNGMGMAPEDLPLALTAHATSKIQDASELDAIATLGFRGEALASIVAVSRVTLVSRATDSPSASSVSGEGGVISDVSPAGAPPGTTVTVRNLFYNTPARRKFLRTENTESNHVFDHVQRAALAHPAIGFRYEKDGKVTLDLPTGQSPRERVLAILGSELERELLEVDADRRGSDQSLSLWGLVGTPALARGTNRYQYFFLNGRPIRDRTIIHAVREAYRGLIDPTRWPLAVLYLEMDPRQVDVNVHPAKAEVRFRDSQSVHGLVLSAIRECLLVADITPDASLNRSQSDAADGSEFQLRTSDPSQSSFDWRTSSTAPDFNSQRSVAQTAPTVDRDRLIEFLRSKGSDVAAQSTASGVKRGFSFQEAREALADENGESDDLSRDAIDASNNQTTTPDTEPQPEQSQPIGFKPRLLQVHDSYVILEEEGGIAIIDQHALHERVMFEALKERILVGPLESQRLLTPAVVDLTPEQIEDRARLASLFNRLGIEVEPLGPRALAVHAFPTLLFERKVDPVTFIAEVFDRLEADSFPPDEEAALHEVLDMMACKAAIKAGDAMNDDEVRGLLDLSEHLERAGRCPHGRPTTIRLSLRDLERQFGRR